MTTEERDRILQLVAYVNTMHDASLRPFRDRDTSDGVMAMLEMLNALDKAKKLCAPIVDSLRNDVPPDGYYPVLDDDEWRPRSCYLRFCEYGVCWGWDEEDDPQRLEDDTVIIINGKRRSASEFVKDVF